MDLVTQGVVGAVVAQSAAKPGNQDHRGNEITGHENLFIISFQSRKTWIKIVSWNF